MASNRWLTDKQAEAAFEVIMDDANWEGRGIGMIRLRRAIGEYGPEFEEMLMASLRTRLHFIPPVLTRRVGPCDPLVPDTVAYMLYCRSLGFGADDAAAMPTPALCDATYLASLVLAAMCGFVAPPDVTYRVRLHLDYRYGTVARSLDRAAARAYLTMLGGSGCQVDFPID